MLSAACNVCGLPMEFPEMTREMKERTTVAELEAILVCDGCRERKARLARFEVVRGGLGDGDELPEGRRGRAESNRGR